MNIFRKITWETMRQNRSRSIVTIVGVLLSATLFTAVTVFTGSLYQYLKDSYIYDMGNYHISVRSADMQLLNACSQDDRTQEILSAEMIGYAPVDSKNEDKPYLYVEAVEESFFMQMPVHLVSGKLPESEDEILLPEHLAGNGSVYYNIGDQITLNLGIRSQKTNAAEILNQSDAWLGADETWTQTGTHTYTVTGFYERPSFEPYSAPGYSALTLQKNSAVSSSGSGIVDTAKTKDNMETMVSASDSWNDKNLDISSEHAINNGQVYDLYIRLADPSKDLESYISDHNLTEYGLYQNNSLLMFSGSFKYNNYSLFFSMIVIFFVLLIFVGSVVLIYNVFSISVSERTRQFGLLSSLGATRRQIRRMVWQEAFFVSLIGIPLGMITGIVGIGITLHFIGDKFKGVVARTTLPMTLHVQWGMLLLAALIALATVLISAWIPSRRAMKVTAMEAIRQSQDIRTSGKDVRVGKLTMKLFGMEGMLGKKYFKRSRKKYRATIISLAFSVIIFISASGYTQYLKESLVGGGLSVSNYDVAFWADEVDRDKEIPLDELKETAGVKDAAYSVSNWWNALIPEDDMADSYQKYIREYRQQAQELMTDGEDVNDVNLFGIPQTVAGMYNMGISVYYLDEDSYEKLIDQQRLSRDKYVKDGAVLPLIYNEGTMENIMAAQRYIWNVDFLKKGIGKLQIVRKTAPDLDGYEYYGVDVEEQDKTAQVYYSYLPEGEDADIDPYTGKLKNGYLVPVDTEEILLGDTVSQLPLGVEASQSGLTLIYPYHMLPSDASGNPECYFKTSDHDVMLTGIQTVLTEKGFHLGEYSFSDPYEREQKDRNTLLIVNVFTYGFIILISLIAIANAFHTISTNMMLRRRDFAMLKSMGMTVKGMRKMLNYECLIYGSRALLIGLPIGFLANLYIFEVTKNIYSGGFHVLLPAYLLSVICVFAVVFITMLYAMKKMKQDNPVDILKNENL